MKFDRLRSWSLFLYALTNNDTDISLYLIIILFRQIVNCDDESSLLLTRQLHTHTHIHKTMIQFSLSHTHRFITLLVHKLSQQHTHLTLFYYSCQCFKNYVHKLKLNTQVSCTNSFKHSGKTSHNSFDLDFSSKQNRYTNTSGIHSHYYKYG